MVGPMSLQFPKQLRGAGNKKPIIGGGTSYDEFVLPFMGDEVIGHVSALQYSAALDTPKNAAFVKAYRAKYGKVPSYYSENNYTTAQMIDEVDQEAGGKCPGPEEFIKIMSAIKVDAMRGPVELRRHAQPDRRTSTSRRSRRRRCSATTRTSSGTRSSRPIRTSASSGRTARTKFLATAGLQPRLPALQVLRTNDNAPGLRIGAPALLFTAEESRVSTDTQPNGGQIPVLELKGPVARASAACTPCATSRSRSCRATARRSSARTAPARPRCST